MKKGSQLILVYLLTAVLVLSSCAQNAPAVPPKAENETAKPAPPSKPEPRPASFSVSGLTITPKEVIAGSAVTIEVLVTNTGELSGTYDVTLKIDDMVEATEKVTLAGGASQKVTFTKTTSTAKTYSVSINGQSANFVGKLSPSYTAPPLPPPPPLPTLDAFMKGISFADWKSFDAPPAIWGQYTAPRADQSLKQLADTGANWIEVNVNVSQETITSTTISRQQPRTATDAELRRIVDLAHSLGIRFFLMPKVHLSKDTAYWTGHIGTTFNNETQWQEWFASYREIINHYAEFSQEAGVDMLSIGHELGGVTHREDDWRRIISEVRLRFKGPITYSSLHTAPWGFPHGEDARIKWWDAVDYIGMEPYYALTNKNDPTVAELKAAWTDRGYLTLMENLSKKYNKPVIISELGYQSADGTNTDPPNFSKFLKAPSDLQEQADCYQAALEVFWGKPWLSGIFWHQWSATGTIWLESPQGKPAANVLRKFYLSP